MRRLPVVIGLGPEHGALTDQLSVELEHKAGLIEFSRDARYLVSPALQHSSGGIYMSLDNVTRHGRPLRVGLISVKLTPASGHVTVTHRYLSFSGC